MKKYAKIGIALFFVCIVYFFSPWWIHWKTEAPENSISNAIKCPAGYERIGYDEGSMADFLRRLPLKAEDVPLTPHHGYFTDSDTIIHYCHRVVDKRLVSSYEQCADVCIHLRADYLYEKRQFSKIHFEDTQHNVMRYWYGKFYPAYFLYLRNTILWANTESLINEMSQRNLKDMEPGDVFVYDYKSRPDAKYGHAIMVADMAVNPKTGEKVFLLVQGSTPACNIHVMKNLIEPELSPWFRLDSKADNIDFGFAKYKKGELRHFE